MNKLHIFLLLILSLLLVGCVGKLDSVVYVYSERHYDTDQALFDLFTEETGIQVEVVKASADQLIHRLKTEGEHTLADVFIVADAGRLHRAKEEGLLQPIESDILTENIPANYKDSEQYWFGLTIRARVLIYHKDRVDPSELSTYEDLTSPKWHGRVITRTSTNIYNQSLLASFIAIHGEEQAESWASGLVANFAQDPRGNDRDQAKAVASGIADVAIMNTYYIGRMLHSLDSEEVLVAQSVGIFFPNQETTGTHVNVSGAGVTRYAKNKEHAIKLIEFLSSEHAQRDFADANFEYPVHPNVAPNALLASWGDFIAQDINLSLLGVYSYKAFEIQTRVGWK